MVIWTLRYHTVIQTIMHPETIKSKHLVSKKRRISDLLGEFLLDPEHRRLHALPVNGPGGVYRIEVTEVLPGSRPKWREVCISELRVMGSDPRSAPFSHAPRFAVGFLPNPTAAQTLDNKKLDALRAGIVTFTRKWVAIETELGKYRSASEFLESDKWELEDLKQRSANATYHLAKLFNAFQAATDRLSWVAKGLRKRLRTEDLDQIELAVVTALEQIDSSALRCQWALSHTRLRLARIVAESKKDRYFAEHDLGLLQQEEMHLDSRGEPTDKIEIKIENQIKEIDARGTASNRLEEIYRQLKNDKPPARVLQLLRNLKVSHPFVNSTNDMKKLIGQLEASDLYCN
jgi:hypothetical protein